VPRVLKTRRDAKRLAAVAMTLVGFALLSGCSSSESADMTRGRQLFVANCGTCHTLAEAATTANVGPNLDAAFVAARDTGMTNDTIQGVVQKQIEHPREVRLSPDDPHYSSVYMPPGLVEGQDAEDVAAYVASVAGVRGIAPPTAPGGPGGQVFANNGCASCHTFAKAQSAGNTGPNLDEVLAGKPTSFIQESIVDPNKQIATGYPANVMPQTYENDIPPKDLKLLVDWLAKFAGK
jgi:cytochrome c2